MHTHRFAIAIAAATLALGLAAAQARDEKGAAKDEKPDGTVSIKETSAAAGVGATWGSGTLTYKGKTYPFRVRGLQAGDVGVATIEATGDVYHLKSLSDFDGTYAAVGAAAAAGPGAGASIMRNDRGVVVELRSKREGAQLKAGVDGLRMELTDAGGKPRSERE
jgi:hypothetical protein